MWDWTPTSPATQIRGDVAARSSLTLTQQVRIRKPVQIGPGRCDALLIAPYGAANGNKGLTAVPSHLFKLVYDEERNVAWSHWHANSDDARGSELISYAELVRRTGVDFLPGVVPK